jgi:uncharacterized protein (TIGR02270 family)
MHRVNPGSALDAAIADPDPSLRGRALRVAGECGRRDLIAECETALADQDPACRFWAASSAALLGDRREAIVALKAISMLAGPFRGRALELVLQAASAPETGNLLKELMQEPENIRLVIHGAGVAGDPHLVPWLIDQIGHPELTRLAGESFTLITGADLAALDLERKPPEDFEPGPNDNPDDPDVSPDADDSLPWPDVQKIKEWWAANASRFQKDTPYFIGAPMTREHCIDVLKNGYQRQRILAARHLCLLEPGTPLFNTSAPAWRQQRLLAKMS